MPGLHVQSEDLAEIQPGTGGRHRSLRGGYDIEIRPPDDVPIGMSDSLDTRHPA